MFERFQMQRQMPTLKQPEKLKMQVSHGLLHAMDKNEATSFEKILCDTYKMREHEVIPSKSPTLYRTTFMHTPYPLSDGTPLSILGEIMDNDNLREGLQLIAEKLPESARFAFVESGYDVKKLAEKGLMIPEYKKALYYCDWVLDTLKKDQSLSKERDVISNPFEKDTVNEKALHRKIRELEEKLEPIANNHFYLDASNDKDIEKLRKLYQCSLANSFKKINTHHLQTALAEIGFKQIKTAGNALYFITHQQIGMVLKLTMTLSSAILEVYDKTWKAQHFKLDTNENRELTPKDYLDLQQLRQRRDKLVQKNVAILLPMLQYLDKKNYPDTQQNLIVSSLLKAFWCKSEEIREKIMNDEDVRYELEEKLKKLYLF